MGFSCHLKKEDQKQRESGVGGFENMALMVANLGHTNREDSKGSKIRPSFSSMPTMGLGI